MFSFFTTNQYQANKNLTKNLFYYPFEFVKSFKVNIQELVRYCLRLWIPLVGGVFSNFLALAYLIHLHDERLPRDL